MDTSCLLYVGRLPVCSSISNHHNSRLRTVSTTMMVCLRRCSQREPKIGPQTTHGDKVKTLVFQRIAVNLLFALLGMIMMSPYEPYSVQ